MVVNVILITASPTPALGRGTSSTRMLLAAWKTVAFIVCIGGSPDQAKACSVLRITQLANRVRQLRRQGLLGKTGRGAICVRQRFHMLFIVTSDYNYRHIIAQRVDRTKQRHPMRAVFEIDYGEIEIMDAADGF